jgi:hypothetical protein
MKEDIQMAIADLGQPDTIYVNSTLDLILIGDVPELNYVQVVINPARYKPNSVSLRFPKRIIAFRPKPKEPIPPKKTREK